MSQTSTAAPLPGLHAAELARSGELADHSHALHTPFGIDVEAQA